MNSGDISGFRPGFVNGYNVSVSLLNLHLISASFFFRINQHFQKTLRSKRFDVLTNLPVIIR